MILVESYPAFRSIFPASVFFALALLLSSCGSSAPTATPPAAQAEAAPAVVRVDTVYVERPAQIVGVNLDTVRAGRFDFGKMWTFDEPPIAYFSEAYDFSPDEAWFEHARLSALRIPGCSASFVSPHGLVMTNHHCGRDYVADVSREGEDLLENGFYAESLDQERKPEEELYADQLIDITDVTGQIEAALEGVSAEERGQAREEAIEAAEAELLEELGGEDAGFVVEVIPLFNGGQYKAYTFRRFDDVRLVMAPELEIGYFGGDPDNFTYPRYNLDVTFFRVYVDDAPYETPHFFRWSVEGASDGEPVFVIGNPGSTNRLQTVAELVYRRDVEDPLFLDLISDRLEILREFRAAHPEAAVDDELLNTIFGLENEQKRQQGVIDGLNDPVLMRRREVAQETFLSDLAADAALQAEYGSLVDEMAAIQEQAREERLAEQLMAFLVNPEIDWISSTLNRAVYGFFYSFQRMQGVPEEDLADLKESLLAVEDQPYALEVKLLESRFRRMRNLLGDDHPAVQNILQGRDPAEVAQSLLEQTAVDDSTQFAGMLETFAQSNDLASAFGRLMAIGLVEYQQAAVPLEERQDDVAGALGRARYALYGAELPPDATSSLRIADGRVLGYTYNGTIAPPFTSFYGLYDRYYTHDGEPWDLPERWLNPPPEFDLSTKLNLVSTNDTVGGNSGSPMINRDLEVVGLLFDGNIEGLSGEFIYTDQVSRAISVDVRGILEAVDDLYGADRLVLELVRDRFVPTEAEADEMMPR